MDCEQSLQKIQELLDKRLDPAETAAMTAHLANCAQCRRTYDTLLSLAKTIEKLPCEQPSALFNSAVLANIKNDRVQEKIPLSSMLSLSLLAVSALLAAARYSPTVQDVFQNISMNGFPFHELEFQLSAPKIIIIFALVTLFQLALYKPGNIGGSHEPH